MSKTKARSIEGLTKRIFTETIELTENQRGVAIDNMLIHFDGNEWRFYLEDLPALEKLKKAIVS